MAIAHDFLEALLQKHLNEINDDRVKCGCLHCIDFDGCNYPADEGKQRLNNETTTWGPIEGPINQVLPGECVEFEVPVPLDEIDHPERWPAYLNLTQCLGLHAALPGSQSWTSRIQALSYSQQVNTVYQMLYSLDHLDDETFETWFTYRGNSLLP